MAANSFHLYEDTFNRLNSTLSIYVHDVATNIIGAITPVATTLLAIYVCLWGWAMLRGVISEPVMDGTNRILRISIVTGIALNLGRYNGFVADFLWNSPDALSSYITSGGAGSVSNTQFLDSLMSQIYDLGDAFWAKANSTSGAMGFPDLMLTICALAIWGAGLAATAYGAFLLVLSKMALAILLGVGPIFILMTLFESTKRFFDAWIGQALNFVFLVMLTAGAIKLIMSIIQVYLNAAGSAGALADPSTDQALPAIVLCVIGSLVMMQLPSIASALGGGVAISTMGAANNLLSRGKSFIGGLASAARPTNIKRSLNRLNSDKRIAVSASKSLYKMVTRR